MNPPSEIHSSNECISEGGFIVWGRFFFDYYFYYVGREFSCLLKLAEKTISVFFTVILFIL